MFSSPPRGIYISTESKKVKKNGETSSRPLHGESIYLLCTWYNYSSRSIVLVPSTGNLYIYLVSFSPCGKCRKCSRPLHGESIYLRYKHQCVKRGVTCSRPLHGESIYLHPDTKAVTDIQRCVLVPSTGNLYIYRADIADQANNLFSSPPRGIYISTTLSICMSVSCVSSRPLHGESIYLPCRWFSRILRWTFSSPPRGIYISTLKWNMG